MSVGLGHEDVGIKGNGTRGCTARLHQHGAPCPDTGLPIAWPIAPGDDASPMLGWLLEGWQKQGLTLRELEMPGRLWQMPKEDHQRLREADMPEWIHDGKPESAPANWVPRGGPEDP